MGATYRERQGPPVAPAHLDQLTHQKKHNKPKTCVATKNSGVENACTKKFTSMTRLHHSFTLLRTSPQHEQARPAIYGKCEQLTPRKTETIIQLQAQNVLIEQRQPKRRIKGGVHVASRSQSFDPHSGHQQPTTRGRGTTRVKPQVLLPSFQVNKKAGSCQHHKTVST